MLQQHGELRWQFHGRVLNLYKKLPTEVTLPTLLMASLDEGSYSEQGVKGACRCHCKESIMVQEMDISSH